jgi:hypothetical protein
MSNAQFEVRSANLATEFGESYARRLFGDDAVDQLPRYVRGPKKGKPKGRVVWKKCVRGGWVGQGSIPDGGGAVGRVESRVGKTTDAVLVYGEWEKPERVLASYSAPYFHQGSAREVQPDVRFWRQ